MSRGRRLVEALAAVAARYALEDQKQKCELLESLQRCAIRHPGTLLRLHEALCFLQAYPDDARVLELVDRALEGFGSRVARLGSAGRRLHDSGIVGATLDYPFGYPMGRWLAARFPRDTEIAWSRFHDADRLDETLSLLATPAEGDAFSEGGMGWRHWLRVAKGGRRMSDLAVVLELFERTGLPEETRDWLYESVAPPILSRPRGQGASRTLARLPCRQVFFHDGGLDRSAGDVVDALRRLPSLVRAPRDRAEAMIEGARAGDGTAPARPPPLPPPDPRRRARGRRGPRAHAGLHRNRAGLPASPRGLLRLSGSEKWRAGELRRRVGIVRHARLRGQHLRVLPPGRIGLPRDAAPAGIPPDLQHADRRRRPLSARPREHRGVALGLVLLLSPARLPPARSGRRPRAGRGAREDRRRPELSLADPVAQAAGCRRGLPDAGGGA